MRNCCPTTSQILGPPWIGFRLSHLTRNYSTFWNNLGGNQLETAIHGTKNLLVPLKKCKLQQNTKSFTLRVFTHAQINYCIIFLISKFKKYAYGNLLTRTRLQTEKQIYSFRLIWSFGLQTKFRAASNQQEISYTRWVCILALF